MGNVLVNKLMGVVVEVAVVVVVVRVVSEVVEVVFCVVAVAGIKGTEAGKVKRPGVGAEELVVVGICVVVVVVVLLETSVSVTSAVRTDADPGISSSISVISIVELMFVSRKDSVEFSAVSSIG